METMRNKKAFTLIELLVVIAIIGLLLAIILPSLKKAKEVAREIICKNNLKQYGICGILYLTDNDTKFPGPWNLIYDNYGGLTDNFHVWHNDRLHPDNQPGYLWPYLQNKKVNLCPVFDSLARSGRATGHVDCAGPPISIPMRPQFGYSMNSFLGGYEGYWPDIKKESDIERSPNQVAYFAEESLWPIFLKDGTTSLGSAPFNDNVLLVRRTVPAAGADPFPFADVLASFHKTNDPDRLYGKSNVVYVDGHVELVAPVNSFNATWVKKGSWISDRE